MDNQSQNQTKQSDSTTQDADLTPDQVLENAKPAEIEIVPNETDETHPTEVEEPSLVEAEGVDKVQNKENETEKPSEEKPVITSETKDDSFKDIFDNKRKDESDDFYPMRKKVGDASDEKKKDKTVTSGKTDIKSSDHYYANRAVAIASTAMVLMLVFGFGGGYLGYRYLPSIISSNTASADEISTGAQPSIVFSPSPIVSPIANIDPAQDWATYTNTKYKYSIDYPKNWFSQNSSNVLIDSIQFSSLRPLQDSINPQFGFQVNIAFKKSNGKLLSDWIKSDNIVNGNGTPTISSLKIDGKDAYQEIIDTKTKSINTYVFQADQVMIISYAAGNQDFETGKKVYQDMVNSIKLN